MNVEASRKPVIRFGPYELDPQNGELRKAGTLIHLQQQPCKLLALLVSRPGEVVPREEIHQYIWNSTTFVDFEQGVNFCIKQIRVALRDHARKPRYVETVPRRGYRFLAPVEEYVLPVHAAPPARVPESNPYSNQATSPRLHVYALIATLVLAASTIVIFRGAPRHTAATSPANRVVLAVLPFANLSGDPEKDYFSEGMTEEIIARFGRMDTRRLAVIGLASVAKFKDVQRSIEEIGRELGVNYILEGSVRASAQRIRVTAWLMHINDSTVLWTGSYDRDLTDILAVQDDIAGAIARHIIARIEPTSHLRAASARK